MRYRNAFNDNICVLKRLKLHRNFVCKYLHTSLQYLKDGLNLNGEIWISDELSNTIYVDSMS